MKRFQQRRENDVYNLFSFCFQNTKGELVHAFLVTCDPVGMSEDNSLTEFFDDLMEKIDDEEEEDTRL